MVSIARSSANIALVKYWGKRDAKLNLPLTGSISLTLKELETQTAVEFDPALQADELELNGKPADKAATDKVTKFLDLIRTRALIQTRARVLSTNTFPTASGLASSSAPDGRQTSGTSARARRSARRTLRASGSGARR